MIAAAGHVKDMYDIGNKIRNFCSFQGFLKAQVNWEEISIFFYPCSDSGITDFLIYF